MVVMPDPIFRAWAEVAYFVSGVVLVFLATAGLAQLIFARRALKAAERQIALAFEVLDVAREDIRIRVKREAVTVAAEQCVKFGEVILPLIDKNIARLKELGIRYGSWTLRNTEFADGSIEEAAQSAEWLKKVQGTENARWLITQILNELEAFAIFFARGAADEEVAYPVTGPSFRGYVEAFAPLLIMLRQQRISGLASGAYQNTIDLYRLWNDRAARIKLEEQADRIQQQLAGLPSKKITPIGGT